MQIDDTLQQIKDIMTNTQVSRVLVTSGKNKTGDTSLNICLLISLAGLHIAPTSVKRMLRIVFISIMANLSVSTIAI